LKSLMLLWKTLAYECASICCTSATQDYKIVLRRCEHEGLSFLTITLPEFGKDLQKGLDRGQVDRDLFTGFRWRAGLPLFLGGFLDRVFDRASGTLLDEPCIDAIRAMRQLTLMFSKILLPCSDTRVRASMRDYVECEQMVKSADNARTDLDRDRFRRISDLLFRPLFSDMEVKLYKGEVVPKHGPGATADKLSGNSKYLLSTWTDRLEEVFPAGEFLIPNWSFFDQYTDVVHLEPGAEKPVRVIPVPKTQKAPRIIAIEPTAMQYAQQGVLELFLEALRRKTSKGRFRFDSLNHFLGFDDQTPNQEMAKEGSRTGNLATLDLSEASDRVSNQLVRDLFANFRYLHAAVDASRSRKADVPGQGIVRLSKFASMGSALTFPVEAMVFLTIIFIGIERELNVPLDHKTVKRFREQVRVYGDDIIIPVDYVQSVVRELETFGFQVNTGKSFWTGKFRESCGRDYYAGHDVSVVKVRQLFPTQRQHATEVISIVSLRNQLYFAGYWATVEWLDEYIKKVIRHFPHVLPSSPVLGRHSFLGYQAERTDEFLHSPIVKGYVISAVPPSDVLDGYGALLKFFLKRGDVATADERHLRRAGRPHVVKIKLRWASAV